MIDKKTLSQLKKLFQSYPPIEVAYLFGSQVKAKTGKLSDVDIAVLFKEKSESLDLVLKLIGELKKTLRREDVDLAVLNEASPTLRHQVVLGGKRLYLRDKEKALEFEKRVFQEHEDTALLRQVYYQYMEERIKNNHFGEFSR